MNKQSQNTKQVRVLRNIWDEEFWQGASEIFSKTGIWTVCSCHVTYTFQSESTLYSCLNVKELLARSRGEIWSLSDCNWARTHNHLVHKRTLNHLAKPAGLAKWFSVRLWTKWLCVKVQLQSLKPGDYSHSREDGEKWTKMGRSPCRVERDGRYEEWFDAKVSASAKNYLLQ